MRRNRLLRTCLNWKMKKAIQKICDEELRTIEKDVGIL